MSRVRHYLSKLPDCDDALRRLADVLQVPAASTSAAGPSRSCSVGSPQG